MGWIQDLASLAKKLLTLETRVETNAEEIKALRQDLQTLTEFTQKVAYAVKRNQERSEDRHILLTKELENELLKLECRLNLTRQTVSVNGSTLPHKALPEGTSRAERSNV